MCPVYLRYFGSFLLALAVCPAWAQDSSSTAPKAGDNSAVNQRDKNQAEPTAGQQSNNRSDLDTTKAIRQALVKDKSLSTYAHNVKVITQNGKVTLKGPVRSDDEKSTIATKAAQVAGQGNITDEMTVVPKHD
jgi:osmotically-inducible protein OsmY